MKKVSAKEQKRKAYEEYLQQEGVLTFEHFQKAAMERVLQDAVESEVDVFLGRKRYEHAATPAEFRGHRNGSYERTIKSAYVRGLSTRDIEQTLIDEKGKPILSRSVVSELNERLYAEYEQFRQRDLSTLEVVYLFVDGVYEAVRKYTNNQAMLCAWAILSNGTKQMVHIAVAQSESQQAGETFFEDLLRRGLRQPLLVISDGNPGLVNAIVQKFPVAHRQRCIAHTLRNIMVKLPHDRQQEILTKVKEIYYTASYESAQLLAARFIEQHAKDFPEAVKCFSDGLEACLTHLKFPAGHHKFIRTTNLLERSFEEEKRRTKILPRHAHERGMMGLVFGVLHRASQRWQNVSMNAVEFSQLRQIRHLVCPKDSDNNYISSRIAA